MGERGAGTEQDKVQENKLELFKARHAYGWAWFDFHAKQRTTVFNYFLIADGLLATAFAANFKPGSYFIASMVALTGAIASFGFFGLEARNRQLVQWGENILRQSESDFLFVAPEASGTQGGGLPSPIDRLPLGILAREFQVLKDSEKLEGRDQQQPTDRRAETETYFGFDGKFMARDGKWMAVHKIFCLSWTSYIGHSYWFPRIIFGFVVLFTILSICAGLFSAGLIPLAISQGKTNAGVMI